MNRKSAGAMLSPCCTPVLYLISLSSFPTCRWTVQPLYILRIVFVRSFGTLNLSSVAYNISWLTELKAFTRLMKKAYVSHPWCLQSVRIEWTVCRASWHPTWPNWFGYPCCLRMLRRQLVMMLLTIFALVSFRQIPLQLFGSCVEPLPVNSMVSFVVCQEGKSVFGLSQ